MRSSGDYERVSETLVGAFGTDRVQERQGEPFRGRCTSRWLSGGQKYPMSCTFMRSSPTACTYRALSEREYYNASAATGNGYLLLMPTRVPPREPGVSVVTALRRQSKRHPMDCGGGKIA